MDAETNPARFIARILVESGVSLNEHFEHDIERLAAYCDAPMDDDALADCDSIWDALLECCMESGLGLRLYFHCGVVRVIPHDPLQSPASLRPEYELGRLW